MLEKDPAKRPDIRQLFKEIVVLESIKELIIILDSADTVFDIVMNSITLKKMFKPDIVHKGLFSSSKCAN